MATVNATNLKDSASLNVKQLLTAPVDKFAKVKVVVPNVIQERAPQVNCAKEMSVLMVAELTQTVEANSPASKANAKIHVCIANAAKSLSAAQQITEHFVFVQMGLQESQL